MLLLLLILGPSGLRRRGVPSTAINAFCREIGITRNDNMVHMHKLEHHIRSELDVSAPRALAVLRPLRVVISNLPEHHYEEVEAKTFPGRSEETYKAPFTKVSRVFFTLHPPLTVIVFFTPNKCPKLALSAF